MKKMFLLFMVFVMLVSMSSVLFADDDTGVPRIWINGPSSVMSNSVWIKLVNPSAGKTARCLAGSWFAGMMPLGDTTTPIGKQILATVLSAATANAPIVLQYTLNGDTSCTFNGIWFP